MQNESSYPLARAAGWRRTERAKRRRAVFGTKPGASERIREFTVAEASGSLYQVGTPARRPAGRIPEYS